MHCMQPWQHFEEKVALGGLRGSSGRGAGEGSLKGKGSFGTLCTACGPVSQLRQLQTVWVSHASLLQKSVVGGAGVLPGVPEAQQCSPPAAAVCHEPPQVPSLSVPHPVP